eukprot:1684839-Rhodomonas_salina.2
MPALTRRVSATGVLDPSEPCAGRSLRVPSAGEGGVGGRDGEAAGDGAHVRARELHGQPEEGAALRDQQPDQCPDRLPSHCMLRPPLHAVREARVSSSSR